MSFLPGILSKNWRLKVLALAMAVLLWTVPRFESQDSRVLEDIPVQIQLNDLNWVQVGPPSPAFVSVTLSGSARDLIAMGVARPPIQVPINEVVAEDTTVQLLSSWFRGSGGDGVVVEDLRPGAVTLSFERKEERHLPFSAPLYGELPEGISQVGPPAIEPSGAIVLGAASRFEGVDSIRLVPLDLSRAGGGPLMQSVDTTGLRGLDPLRLEASVEVPTEPTATREFPGLVLRLPRLDSDPQLQVFPTSVTVMIAGPTSLVEAVNSEDLAVTIPTGRTNLAPGGEDQLVVVVEGVPDWVGYTVDPEWVILRRPAGQ